MSIGTSGPLTARLGIFARTFPRPASGAVLADVKAAGYALAHWNFAATGHSTLGSDVTEDDVTEVRTRAEELGLGIPSISATYNVADPDAEKCREHTAQAVRLIGMTPLLGVDVVTLCTGTRDPQDMWRAHPDNTTSAAWDDLRRALDALLPAAADAGVRLGIEPEPGNIVRDAHAAARLLDELGKNAPVGIIFDAANLLTPDTIEDQEHILSEAAELLGPHVVGAQAKDVVASGYSAPGTGAMDYHLVLRLLRRMPAVPLIVQDTTADDASRVHHDLVAWDAELNDTGTP
ncbi:TIM barrel protein [Rhodococcus sp. NPDC049939]|uniref:sugar phosphate isomerase/epimerase family protein n=1 Tax=Rhodococcus sp. NPDC049939 TaxID=3155511 RepID=UPI0033D7DFB1